MAGPLRLELRHRVTDYSSLSKRVPYQLGLRPHGGKEYCTILSLIYACNCICISRRRVAGQEGFEPSHRLSRPTPLAGEPLQPTWVLSHIM